MHYQDFERMKKIIDSCVNTVQNNHCFRLIQLYERKHPKYAYLSNELYHLCDANLAKIWEEFKGA